MVLNSDCSIRITFPNRGITRPQPEILISLFWSVARGLIPCQISPDDSDVWPGAKATVFLRAKGHRENTGCSLGELGPSQTALG